MTGPQPKAPPKKVPPTKPTKRAGMGKQDPKYLRAYRVRTGRQDRPFPRPRETRAGLKMGRPPMLTHREPLAKRNKPLGGTRSDDHDHHTKPPTPTGTNRTAVRAAQPHPHPRPPDTPVPASVQAGSTTRPNQTARAGTA